VIAGALAAGARAHAERVFLADGRRRWTYGEYEAAVAELAGRLHGQAGARIAVVGGSLDSIVLRLLALDRIGARAYLVPPALDPGVTGELAGALRLHALLDSSGELDVRMPASCDHPAGEVVLFTSGTTGLPKAALHTWHSLAGRVRRRPELQGSSWLLTYHPSAFAGVQVFLHVLLNAPATLVLGEGSPAAVAALASRERVTHVSATPTFFRLLLAGTNPATLANLPLRQITLGGEVVDQTVLDAARKRFPQAQVTHIYASTEMGACFAVHDGAAGFPASYLDNESIGVVVAIVGGELCIRSPRAMQGYLDGAAVQPAPALFPTGDLVEVSGDRVRFRGRRSERLNVGGNKVDPCEVEEAVREVPGVVSVRVSGLPSSVAGQLVRAEVVLETGAEPAAMRGSILAHCRTRLRPFKVPRQLEFVEHLDQTASRKIARA
jgi:acyl-coenzyme A synthetase/AMP-(fatty) acid ligase